MAIVTSDNPRSEDPEAIIAEILAGDGAPGAERRGRADRRAAIERAVALARPGDVVVIAGKGHEQGQEFAGGRKVPFDDVDRRARGAACASWSPEQRRRRRAGAAARGAGAARRRPARAP